MPMPFIMMVYYLTLGFYCVMSSADQMLGQPWDDVTCYSDHNYPEMMFFMIRSWVRVSGVGNQAVYHLTMDRSEDKSDLASSIIIIFISKKTKRVSP